jgi:hypothetical protein
MWREAPCYSIRSVVMYFIDFRFCYQCFQKLTAKFQFCSNRFKISKFRTCQWQKLKSQYRSYLLHFKGRHLQADMTPAEMVTYQVSTSPFRSFNDLVDLLMTPCTSWLFGIGHLSPGDKQKAFNTKVLIGRKSFIAYAPEKKITSLLNLSAKRRTVYMCFTGAP